MSTPHPDPTPLTLDAVRALLDAAWTCRRADPQETVRLARVALGQPLQDAELARARLGLGYGLVRLGEFVGAQPETRRALELFGELGDQEGQRTALNVLGMVQSELGHPVAALETFMRVRQLSVALDNEQGEVEALNNIGQVYEAMGDHPNALHHRLLTLQLSQQRGLRTTERMALNNLSVTYYDLGRYDDALEAATTSLNVKADADPCVHAMALHNAGRAHYGLGAFSQAHALHLEALALFGQEGDRAASAEVYVELGRLAQQQRAPAEARPLYERSLRLRQQTGDVRGQTESLLRLGELLRGLGQLEESLSALHNARTLAEQSQARTELSATDLALSQTYRQAGQYREALYHLEQHLQLNGELFSAASDQRLQSLKVQFDLEQAERERAAAERLNAELSDLNARLEFANQDLRAAQARTAELLERVERHANEDALTGLPNRRAFDAALARLSPDEEVSLVLCDIDHFKAVNDRFSHLIGDDVLRRVAALLKGQLRQEDLLARYGGEEFVLLMTRTGAETTASICERLRQTVEGHDWSSIRPELGVTISLGAAVQQLHPQETTVPEVIQAADDALYTAKRAGRNRVHLWPGKSSARE